MMAAEQPTSKVKEEAKQGVPPKGNYQREEASRSSPPISGPAAPVFRPSTHTCVVGHKIGFMGRGSALPRRHISARTSTRFFFFICFIHLPAYGRDVKGSSQKIFREKRRNRRRTERGEADESRIKSTHHLFLFYKKMTGIYQNGVLLHPISLLIWLQCKQHDLYWNAYKYDLRL